MNKYTKPTAEFTAFSVENIITESGVISGTSGVVVNSGTLTGEDKTMYEVYSQNSAAPSTNVSIFTW